MDDRERRGIVMFTMPELAKQLGLNAAHKIVGVHFEFVQQRLCLLVDGPEMPKVWPGDLLQVADLAAAQAPV